MPIANDNSNDNSDDNYNDNSNDNINQQWQWWKMIDGIGSGDSVAVVDIEC